MLLKLLYDFAHSRKLLDDLAFTPKAIRWIIPLDEEGNLLGNGVQETTGNKNRGKDYSVPQTSQAKNAGGIAEFLADNLTGLFSLDTDPEKDQDNAKKRKDRDTNNTAKYHDFWRQIHDANEKTGHPALNALLNFHQQTQNAPTFIRWGISQEAKPTEKASWWLTTATGNQVKLGADNFTFTVAGKLLLADETLLRPYWREVYQQELDTTTTKAKRGICLITGHNDAAIAATHSPKIKGVPNTQSFGAAIVSFDKDAFASYGFDQSHNAPGSTTAVSAYCNALNFLLTEPDHHLRIGQTSVCFWARDTQTASSFFAYMLNRPDPASVAEFLKTPWAGISREQARHDAFYSVTLTGNAGRIIVRHWLQTTLEASREHLHAWFSDLQICTYGSPIPEEKRKAKASETKEPMPPLALFLLACSTVREAKDLQTETLNQLYRAALEGIAPSVILLKPILHRLTTDLAKHGPKTLHNVSRFALLRLILNRNRKEGEPMIEPSVFETDDPAYNCGRLLAIFDDLQMQAHDYKLEGAGVVERYYGSASSSPNSAFGILWRLHQHHLKKISQKGDKGKQAAFAIKQRIAGIAALFSAPGPNLPPQFPRTFNLQEQGRFALGFYQQMAARKAAIDDYMNNKPANTAKPEDPTNEIEPTDHLPTHHGA